MEFRLLWGQGQRLPNQRQRFVPRLPLRGKVGLAVESQRRRIGVARQRGRMGLVEEQHQDGGETD